VQFAQTTKAKKRTVANTKKYTQEMPQKVRRGVQYVVITLIVGVAEDPFPDRVIKINQEKKAAWPKHFSVTIN